MPQRILTNQGDITVTQRDEIPSASLEDGEARLQLESFALTANNVTYAATGFVIGYWEFFPSGIEGQGIVPVWGTARVTESRSEALLAGARLYGFFPMAEELVIRPERDESGMIIDRSTHRSELPAVYNRYAELRDADWREDGLRALLQPLLATSFVLADWLEDNVFFGAEQIIIGSASSKTGLGLAKFLAALEARDFSIIGLTSEGNRGFVEGLGDCDKVLNYDEIESVDRRPSVYIDMAGNADVKFQLHTHLGEEMKHSAAVGTSHWDKFAKPQQMPGARPQFFFAPSQIAKRREDWGPGVIERKITAAWKRVAADAESWMTLRRHTGLEAAQPIYDALARGKANPAEGHVIVL